MIKSKKQSFIVIGVFALVLMLGTVTYAFFNYTRTGSANTIRTGRIAFNSQQGTAINLTNVFPVDVTNGIPNNSNVGSVTINVTGDTTYTDGIEYLVSAVNVQNTVGSGANAKSLPISIDVSVASNTNNDPAATLGTADSDYFTNRGASANTSIYKVLANDVIANNDQLLVGYIKSGATGVDGNIVIRAYIDKAKVAISDTYPEQTVHTVKTTGYSSANCETALTGVQDASTYCSTASDLQDAIDNEDLTSSQITLLVNAGIVEEYTNGTPSSFGEGRTVFTTSEWNSLQQNGVSFQVKVESNEGEWVTAPATSEETSICPGCKFMYTTNDYGFHPGYESTISEIEENNDVLYDDYTELVNDLNKNYFLGLTFNESTNKIEKVYTCGIKGENPHIYEAFCIEGTYSGSPSASSVFSNNKTILDSIWQGTCDITSDENVQCTGLVNAYTNVYGTVVTGDPADSSYNYCVVFDDESVVTCDR